MLIIGGMEFKFIRFRIKVPEISQSALLEAEEDEPGTWYIPRLIVPPKLRHQGLATSLLSELASWADDNRIKLVLYINPYGDLDREQLQKLYYKFGFRAPAVPDDFYTRDPGEEGKS